jgi:hypothetical protein
MNQFGFTHLPFALANQQNPFQSLAQPSVPRPMGITGPGSPPRSGVNSFLGTDPQTQQRLQAIQTSPFMSTAGTTVPQNTWNGNQFNIPVLPANPGITTPGAPVPATPAPNMQVGPNGWWDAPQFTPIGLKSDGSNYARPQGFTPPAGYEWNQRLGFWEDPISIAKEKAYQRSMNGD